jgi:hypothetical protein
MPMGGATDYLTQTFCMMADRGDAAGVFVLRKLAALTPARPALF